MILIQNIQAQKPNIQRQSYHMRNLKKLKIMPGMLFLHLDVLVGVGLIS